MKTSTFIALAAALACSAAFAQAPPGVLKRAPAESDPNTTTGGRPAAKAQARTDVRNGTVPLAYSAENVTEIDTNSDGVISRREWDRFHAKTWSRMNAKNGMVPRADFEATLKGGPN
ncbi:MAG: hypothetical protein IPK34_17860 [Ramlibacter sp.]|jgi:hypothetical protein|nr:hypothetical protein [Ramlibacter sp.]